MKTASGLDVQKDSVFLRIMHENGEKIQRLCQYDRRIFDLSASISRNLVKLDACMQRCNIRISNFVSTVDLKGYRTVVKMISQGVTDPEVLVGALHGKTVNKHGLSFYRGIYIN